MKNQTLKNNIFQIFKLKKLSLKTQYKILVWPYNTSADVSKGGKRCKQIRQKWQLESRKSVIVFVLFLEVYVYGLVKMDKK
jgi:hypothetical protein